VQLDRRRAALHAKIPLDTVVGHARSVAFVTGEQLPAPTTLAGRGAPEHLIPSVDAARTQHAATELDLQTIGLYLESTQEAVLVCSLTSDILFAGGATQSILGVASTDLAGRPLSFDLATAMNDREVALAPDPATNRQRVAELKSRRTNWFGHEAYLLVLREVTSLRRNEELVRRNEERFRTLMASAPIGIFQLSPSGLIAYANPRVTEMMGPWKAGMDLRTLVIDEDRQRLDDLISATLRYTDSDGTTVRAIALDGTTRSIRVRMGMLFDASGDIRGLVGSAADVTVSVEAQQSRDRLIAILEATPDIVAICEPDGTLSYLNQAARAFLGILDAKEFLGGLKVTDLYPGWARVQWRNHVLPNALQSGIWSGDLAMLGADGREIIVSQVTVAHQINGVTSYVSTIARDVTEQRELAQKLQHQALHDPLTGLPNRNLLTDRLTSALARLSRRRNNVALIFGDLDRFKLINDTLGHAIGDRLLLEVTQRVKNALRPGDTVARFGGDEFVVLCEDVTDADEARDIARRLVKTISAPYSIEGSEIYVTTSLGLTLTDRPDSDPGSLLRDADMAMYHAKERGKNCFEIFDVSMRNRLVARASDERDLHRALDRDELFVEYQPEIRLVDGAMVGVEALARWRHPTDGVVYPGRFIDVAEDTGLIGQLGHQILTKACNDARALQSLRTPLLDLRTRQEQYASPGGEVRHDPNLRVAINLSGRQLAMPDIVDQIQQVISRSGADPSWLALEVTESVLMEDLDYTIGVLRELRSLDIRIGIDDFGTGYSSLAHLRSFPVDFLKIDRSFVMDIGTERGDGAIVATIINLAHNLGMAAIAEGVETQLQLATLAQLGCDLAQGFGIAKPVTLQKLLGPESSADLVGS
jgi:diguanylate cyclase (GGDEF)-like protein/PAS domain S-box-containing protein